MYVCCAFCKFFPVHLLAPIAKIFNRQLNFDQQFWIEIRDEMDSASNFFSHILPPRGQFRRPNVECGSKSAIIGENLWKYSWSHQELPSHSPLIPLYSLSSAAGETRFLPQRGNNQTSTTRSSQSGNHFITEELFIVKRHFSINSGLVDWFSTKFPATIVKIFHFCQVSSFRRTPVFQ